MASKPPTPPAAKTAAPGSITEISGIAVLRKIDDVARDGLGGWFTTESTEITERGAGVN